jgi:hypothetical protein
MAPLRATWELRNRRPSEELRSEFLPPARKQIRSPVFIP